MNIIYVIKELKKARSSHKLISRYSVFAPLVEINNSTHLLFEVRSDQLRKQPGEISFPGGRIEEGESWREAAIRETREELNLDDDQIEWISDLNLATISDSRLVYAGVGRILTDFSNIKANEDEVYKIFTVPLSFFLNTTPDIYHVKKEIRPPHDFPYELIPNGRSYRWSDEGYDIPFYVYDNNIIWGLTARIIIDIVSRLQ